MTLSLTPFSSLFISPAELHHVLSDSSNAVRVIPLVAGRNSNWHSFEAQHIPGSIFFNMDLIRDTTSPYPMMLPTPAQFAGYMSQLRITPDDVLVVYDPVEPGFYSSPRVAWMCQYFGHRAVHVLNTFPRYVDEGFPVESGGKPEAVVSTSSRDDNPTPRGTTTVTYPEQRVSPAKNVISFEELRDIISQSDRRDQVQIIDSRPSARFSGPPDPDQSVLPVGHIPSAINVPFSSILGSDRTVLPPGQLKEFFERAGVKQGVPSVLYCNTAVTAAGLDLALSACGYDVPRRLYDGSWSEWVRRVDQDLMVTE